jgi:hypothetical protein
LQFLGLGLERRAVGGLADLAGELGDLAAEPVRVGLGLDLVVVALGRQVGQLLGERLVLVAAVAGLAADLLEVVVRGRRGPSPASR